MKCSHCGTVNLTGTTICSQCGQPLEQNNDSTKLLNMRYDGAAIRSKTRNKSIVDKIWNFFSSIKVGVTLIAIALVASALGTIYPQQIYIPNNIEPSAYYEQEYGITGRIYYQLGFHELYSSWWYMIIIAMIGISIFIVSIDRGVPLYKALKNQNPKRHPSFIKRQKLFSRSESITDDEKNLFVETLKKHRYKIYEKDGHILAEKGRFSRWGPYVNHAGLIIFLIGTLLRFVPGVYVDEFVWIREGETAVIPATNQEYYIENHDFIMEVYGDEEEDEKFSAVLEKTESMVPKNFQTDVTIYRDEAKDIVGAKPDLKEVKSGSIRVNHPMKIAGLTLYQDSFQQNEFESMSFKLHEVHDENEEAIVELTVDLTDPNKEYEFDNGFRLELSEYFPDYTIENGQPRSQTNFPRNPGFVFFVYPPGEENNPEVSFLAIGQNIPGDENNQYKLSLTGFDVREVSGLSVKKDLTLPIIAVGAIIFLIGVVQGMYWQHRRIWIHPTGNELLIACHTNKNWYGLTKEFEKMIEGTTISMVNDQENKNEE